MQFQHLVESVTFGNAAAEIAWSFGAVKKPLARQRTYIPRLSWEYWWNHEDRLMLSDEAEAFISNRTVSVLKGCFTANSVLLRIYWQRFIRPRIDDDLRASLNDATYQPLPHPLS
jgi:hypothetical protein